MPVIVSVRVPRPVLEFVETVSTDVLPPVGDALNEAVDLLGSPLTVDRKSVV